MADIKILPQTIVNKIAAGEVIERPASVIKELVENSIDAGALRIEMQLEDSGKKLIRVSDNGAGMEREDVELAFHSHATSKLKEAEDIFSIDTLGFRGEALPSIGSVSQARILSRPKGALTGSEITIEGGNLHKIKEKGAPEGTQVDVHNLFYNIPVRRKFLKSTQTEMAHISEMVIRFALAYPNIHFSTLHNGKNVSLFPSARNARERIETIFGNEMCKELISINSEEPELSIFGYVLPPTYTRPNSKMQYVFLNGRFIRDSTLHHAINNAYRNLLMSKRSPIVFLFLHVDSSEVDVNVHPTKREVRFRNAGIIHDQIYSAINSALKQTQSQYQPSLQTANQDTYSKLETSHGKREESVMESMSDFFSNSLERKIDSQAGLYEKGQKNEYVSQPLEKFIPSGNILLTSFLQIHNSYIVEETDQGLNIIDQHALHEIILYHEICDHIKNSKLVTQNLLIPELIELTPADYVAIMDLKDMLNRLGLEIEEFGKNTIAIRTHPQILKNLNYGDLVQSLLKEINNSEVRPNTDDVLSKVVNILACKGAVKSGQKLNSQEIQALLDKKKKSSMTNFCPHGRPTILEFKISDLEKQFKRK
ncbi:MAG: DNA mismatch repair endonuclease MutL [Planctomycetes bacterium]|nr:DNA mismatch repair endonuclease MutL [Planctomycetota bacterium]